MIDTVSGAKASAVAYSLVETAKANGLNVSNGVENNSVLDLNGSGSIGSSIRGTGRTNILDSMSTSKTIEQNILSVSSAKTFEANANVTVNESLINNGIISNSKLFKITSSTGNSGEITGEGTLELSADFENSGTISQKALVNDGILTNNITKQISVGTTLTSVSVALITLGCIKAFNWAFLSVGIVSAVLALPAWIILIPMLYVIYQYRKPYLKNPFDIDDYSFSCGFRIEL